MVSNFEDIQKLGQDNMDATMKSFDAASKNVQAIVTEITDFSKKAFEQNSAAVEKLAGVRSLDKVFEVQSDLLKTSYETYVAQATKFGEMFTNLAKETYSPFESFMGKVSAVAK